METYVALLRGVNLGARNRIAMSALRGIVAGLGYADVRTHLQSGNVLLRSAAPAREVAAAIEQAVEQATGLAIPVLVRSSGQLRAIVAGDPFADVATDRSRHLVAFVASKPDGAALARLERLRGDDERLHVGGLELHVWCPAGLHRSRLGTACNDRDLHVTTTVRNWRTVEKLAELAAG